MRHIIAFLAGACWIAGLAAADFSAVPGVVINHSPKSTRMYIGSPSIAILPNGLYIASHDHFGPGTTHNQTRVFASQDKGRTWEPISTISGQFWSNLFWHNDTLYIMGTSSGPGKCIIRKSTDHGRTWTTPIDMNTGILSPDTQYHTAPMPVVIHNGRIWRAMDDARGGTQWGSQFRVFIMSAPVDADLLKASSWTFTNRIGYNADWLNGRFGGFLEGNAVIDPNGNIFNILRVDYRDVPEKAAIVRISQDGSTAAFDPENDFITFPGGCKKFVIRHDPVSNRYWTLSNAVLPQHIGGNVERTRNAQVLMSSADLRNWTEHSIALYHPNVSNHGFQYLDWQFEGDDIVAVSRTAYDDGLGGADNQHNANFMTFHRVENFRSLNDIDQNKLLRSLYIDKPTYTSPDKHLVARWCFETGQYPAHDTAPAGKSRDNLEVLGPVRFENGIAKFPAGIEGVGLRAESSPDLSPNTEMTVWLRFKVYGKGEQYLSLVDKRSFSPEHRSYGMFIAPDAGSGHLFGVGGQVSSTGRSDGVMALMRPDEQLPVDLWLQAAMVVRAKEMRLVTEWYYRTEDSDRRNPWKLSGRSGGGRSIYQSDVPLIIGNDANLKALCAELWIDEVRIYDRALTVEELGQCWALLKTYEEIPAQVPGIVIDHSPAKSGIYLGAPAIVILPDGTYIAKCQEVGPNARKIISRIYRSKDRGQTWAHISSLEMCWSNLFMHQDTLYMMGTTTGHGRGRVVIRKSLDGGCTWTNPIDENSGLLFGDLPYHTAPVPTVIHNGRLWRAMEDERGRPGGWGTSFRAFMMSAPAEADLLKASSWTASDRLGYNPGWLDGRFRGWLEGNAVVGPDGGVVNILRVDYRPEGGKAAIVRYSPDGTQSYFDPQKDFIDFPGGAKKFVVRHDVVSSRYWALSSAILPKHTSGNLERAREYVRGRTIVSSNPGGRNAFSNPERIRNTLVLMSSRDLRNWQIHDVILYHPEVNQHGFQYPDLHFDGPDIIFVSRTAYDDGLGGANNQHDANYFTFHRIQDFRDKW